MTDGEPPKSRPIRTYKSTAGLRLRPGDRARVNDSVRWQETKEKERSYRIALASLILSIVVAVITPGSAWLVARMSVTSSEHQADTTFIRDQKKAAYSDFYASATEVSQAALGVARPSSFPRPEAAPNGGDSSAKGQFELRVNQLLIKVNDLIGKYARIYMVGSTEVVESAERLRDYLVYELMPAVEQEGLDIVNNPAEGENQLPGRLSEKIGAGDALLKDFLNAVRADYGSQPMK